MELAAVHAGAPLWLLCFARLSAEYVTKQALSCSHSFSEQLAPERQRSLNDDLDRRLACIHLDCQFRVPKIDLVAPSIGAPENSVCHVAPCNRNFR